MSIDYCYINVENCTLYIVICKTHLDEMIRYFNKAMQKNKNKENIIRQNGSFKDMKKFTNKRNKNTVVLSFTK